ncbi:MAG: hypothetical protein AAF938_00270 [Myxococcota bacterium]
MNEEEEFRAALKKSRGNPLAIVPILGAGVVGLGALAGTWFLWPFERIPIVALFGIPIVIGGATLVGLQRVLGIDE